MVRASARDPGGQTLFLMGKLFPEFLMNVNKYEVPMKKRSFGALFGDFINGASSMDVSVCEKASSRKAERLHVRILLEALHRSRPCCEESIV